MKAKVLLGGPLRLLRASTVTGSRKVACSGSTIYRPSTCGAEFGAPVETSDPVFHSIDLDNMKGLEIGPLYRPRVAPAYDVRYVDHYSTEELRVGYAVNSVASPFIDDIVEVDYVLRDGATVASATEKDAPFDYVVASHVIEHVVDPISWLRDIGEILAPGGVISLVVPDKRFCFDVNRDLTSPQDWIDWYLRRLEVPSLAQLFDFFAHVTTLNGTVDTARLWAGPIDYSDVHRSDVADPDSDALAACIKHQETGEYKDIHAGVYTPESFLGLLRLAMKLELLNF